MNVASRMTCWGGGSEYAIRVGRNMSYLDTLQYIDNTDTTLMMDFKFNGT